MSVLGSLKSSMFVIGPAIASYDAPPIRPSPQLSSIKRNAEVWSVSELSTKFDFANGEITRNGSLTPYPQRAGIPSVFLLPQCPAELSASREVVDCFTIGDIWWSYQPSESSHRIITTVLAHSGRCCSAFKVFTRNCCSSSGDEYPACPSCAFFAFRKLTAGMLPLFTASQKSVRSY